MSDELNTWLDDLVDVLDPPPAHLADQVGVLLIIALALRAA
ncbi:hypothetical protein ABZ816_09945 [Actinosynnema sp. NPDC047251]|uniref:Secreted protein n=1 Tax=Saccharothrix espanaensis (strain ATCC 51144 / DSM 44229 / JCM 9112 / NBRC 15066 / NRRL 15764) TaxID=1179773 RepID=K0K9E2_SACES|nr:hypothetical protein [Saccharothrix espanaensis]CCH34132.1 hypothetical protein BN6_68950 [Saccharothrix espanaensis DSM 44229]